MSVNVRPKENNTAAWILFAVIVAVIAVFIIGIVCYFIFKDSASYDRATGCPVVNGRVSPSSQVIVVIDETDHLTDIQADYLRVSLRKLAQNEMEPGSLLTIYSLKDRIGADRKPVFEACKVRDGSDANALTENERLIRRRFIKFFKRPLENIIRSAEEADGTSSSPIFEVIQSASVNSVKKWDPPEGTRLVIYSDMLHNTSGFSMYQRHPNFEAFKKTPYAVQTRSDLSGVEVDLRYFMSSPKFQGQDNLKFWKAYFRNAGAVVESVVPIGK